jgi:hypothetical protein
MLPSLGDTANLPSDNGTPEIFDCKPITALAALGKSDKSVFEAVLATLFATTLAVPVSVDIPCPIADPMEFLRAVGTSGLVNKFFTAGLTVPFQKSVTGFVSINGPDVNVDMPDNPDMPRTPSPTIDFATCIIGDAEYETNFEIPSVIEVLFLPNGLTYPNKVEPKDCIPFTT